MLQCGATQHTTTNHIKHPLRCSVLDVKLQESSSSTQPGWLASFLS
jgi:hypothetical protein